MHELHISRPTMSSVTWSPNSVTLSPGLTFLAECDGLRGVRFVVVVVAVPVVTVTAAAAVVFLIRRLFGRTRPMVVFEVDSYTIYFVN